MEYINNIDFITKEIVDTVLELLKDKIYKIVLYGSYARGDFTMDSDIDIMILLNGSKEEMKAFRNQVSRVASRISLKNDIHISLMLQDRETFERHLNILPFFKTVEKEGVSLYG